MPTTNSILGRMKLVHPDMGHDGGATLETKIKTLYTLLSDDMPSRLFTFNLGDGDSVDFEHGFKCAFSELGFRLYLWDSGTGQLTRINPTTGWTVAAKVGSETTFVTVTNNTGSGKEFALWLFQWPLVEKLDDLTDVDLVATAPEDGQALVFSAALGKWLPGASGDSSFKIQGITDPNATIKGGFLMLPDGRELATYDGAGSASTDFGKDITVDLDAVLGSSPADNTTYYLYIDLATLGAAVTCTDNGRKLYAVQYSNFFLSTTAPESMNRSRYIARGFIHSADSGTVWSGTGATYGTLAFLKAEQPPVAVSPLVFSQSQTTVSTVGTSGQIRQGHELTQKSFPAAALNAANLSFFNLDGVGTGAFGGRDLTLQGSPAAAVGILGDAGGAIALNGTSQYLESTDSFFDPGDQNFAVGGWLYSADWVPASGQFLFGQGDAASDKVFAVSLNSDGTIKIAASVDGSAWDTNAGILHGFGDGMAAWHHVAIKYSASTNTFTLYLDGKPVYSATLSGNLRNGTNPDSFQIGALAGATFFAGRADEFFAVVGVDLGDHDISVLASTKIDHNKALPAGRQNWVLNHYAAGVKPVTPLANAVLDQSDSNTVFLDLSQADPTDKIDIQLFDSGAAGAVSVPVQTAEFTFSATGQLTAATTAFPTNLVEDVRSMAAWQKTTNGWEPIDLVGMVWVTATGAKYLQGNIDGLPVPPSATNPVRVIVASTASAQAVGVATATQAGLYVAGKAPGRRDGQAPNQYEVGEEIIAFATTTNTTLGNTEIDVTGASVTTTEGEWELEYVAAMIISRPVGGAGTMVFGRVQITDGSNNPISGTAQTCSTSETATGTVSTIYTNCYSRKRVRAPGVYKMRLTCNAATANGTASVTSGDQTGGITGNETTSYIRATRVS